MIAPVSLRAVVDTRSGTALAVSTLRVQVNA